MSTRVGGQGGVVVESRDELVAYLEGGSKPEVEWRVGTEHEKFGYTIADGSALPYFGEYGIAALLAEYSRRFGWTPILEGSNIIALSCPDNRLGGTISLEPGGQIELSGSPLTTIHAVKEELRQHLNGICAVARDLGAGMFGLGFTPKWTLSELTTVPKSRYKVMARYMPTRSRHGLDMMFRTAAVQVNLDFGSERDMVQKLRVGLALQPVVTALFANSPFSAGKPNGFKSYRAEVWRHTDPDRTGVLPFVFEHGMGFERYVDYALGVPMYFVYQNGGYVDVAGASFRDFLNGELHALPGVKPTLDDWADHLTTLFPQVRLKRFLEMRGADAGSFDMLLALPALWVGLLYDNTSLNHATNMIADWTTEERQAMYDSVPRLGLSTRFRNSTVREVAREVLEIAAGGLLRRACVDASGNDEGNALLPLFDIVEDGRSHADRLLDAYEKMWGRRIDCIFESQALCA